MKIHSNVITAEDIHNATTCMEGVYATVTQHKSRSHGTAFNVTLEGNSSRMQNNGSGDRAATWDEWGIMMHNLFQEDPYALWGTPKYPAYENEEDFDYKTGGRFTELEHAEQCKNHRWEFVGVPRSQSCKKCDATRNW